MRALCGDGRALSSDAVGNGSGRETGMERSWLLVGPGSMKCVIKSGTREGRTLSTIVNAGRRRTEVGSL